MPLLPTRTPATFGWTSLAKFRTWTRLMCGSLAGGWVFLVLDDTEYRLPIPRCADGEIHYFKPSKEVKDGINNQDRIADFEDRSLPTYP